MRIRNANSNIKRVRITDILFYFILFYFISFYFILFYFILFHFILFYFISFHFISFCFILFHFISFYFILFHFILFYFILFYFILFYFILFYFILFHFILFYFILFYFIFTSDARKFRTLHKVTTDTLNQKLKEARYHLSWLMIMTRPLCNVKDSRQVTRAPCQRLTKTADCCSHIPVWYQNFRHICLPSNFYTTATTINWPITAILTPI